MNFIKSSLLSSPDTQDTDRKRKLKCSRQKHLNDIYKKQFMSLSRMKAWRVNRQNMFFSCLPEWDSFFSESLEKFTYRGHLNCKNQ